ncbi:MAG: hypothetical protein ACRC7N_20680 [Clostridium sp.]
MNIVKTVKEIEIEGKEYIMTFDMRSIPVFQKLAKKSFIQSTPKLFAYDDETVIHFIGSTLRPKEQPDKIVGEDIYNFDILGLLLTHSNDVITIVADSLPNSSGKK